MLPEVSVAVQVTVVVPTGKTEPEAGLQTTVTPGQLSLAVAAKVASAPVGQVGSFTMLAGHVMAGGCVSMTVTVNEQLAVWLDVSVAVQSTGVVPFGNVDPDGGLQLEVTPGQLSFAVGEKLTTAEHRFSAVVVVMFAGQLIVGFSSSLTVTVNEHAVEVLPLASVAVHVTGVVPFWNVEPDAGLQLAVAPGQLSLAVAEKFTTAEQLPVSFPWVMLAGQLIVGFSLSLTVTVNEQLPVLLCASVAEHVTVVVPLANVEPDAGEQVTAPTPGQLSVAVGVV